MACQRCVAALQEAADALLQMQQLEPWDLPEGTDWEALRVALVTLAGQLRRDSNAPES